ncbi:Nucleoporin [Exophiala dermatitidis]
MSFGSGSGFNFGSNSNTQNTGFGGFGSTTNTNTGFGSTTNTGFGSSTAAASPFGGSTFGSNTGGFGAAANTSGSLFGSKPASNPFGSSTTNTGGGLFGGSTNANTGFGSSTGGFGSTNNAFGGTNTGGSSFSFGSANKPAFGSSTSTTPLFGQGGSGTTGTFGASTAFGATGSGTALSSQPVPPPDGTASTPFAPTVEKDAAGVTSNYQSITFMQPYQKYSFEELRLADYNAGRRFGNATGQAGGFGSSTFGGFGATNTPAFGNNTTSTTPFGAATTSSTGFGSASSTTGFGGGGLFGNKPATGGLFGQQSSGTTSGGLFGTAGNTTSAFGGGSTGFGSTGTTGGGLFGNNNATQNKPSPFGGSTGTPSFSFGNTNTANTGAATGTGTGTGLFGGGATNTTTNAFGGTNQQSGGLFGNQQQKPLFGGNTTGGFGTPATQGQQSGGLFGGTTNTATQPTGGGLFGSANTSANTNTGGGLFSSNNATGGGSLFGNNNNNNAQKPGGLFGGSTFGNTNTGNTGGGLFGSTGTNNQQTGGLFGNTNTGGGFSFGNTANKPATTSLFANTNNNQQGGLSGSTGNFGGGLFGTSQTAQSGNQQQQDIKHASLNDPNPYGQTSIWTGLPVPTPDTAKPIFTPLAATQKMKESQAKPPPSLRLNQSRYMTPPRRSGFGFSYSTYGTPNSAASTPGGNSLTSSMYGSRSFNGGSFGSLGSFGRSFGKSASASNLRSQFNGDNESVLSPHAFTATTTRWSNSNMRRLTIDRNIRNDLFSRPSLPALPSSSSDRPASNGSNELVTTNGEPSSEPSSKLKKRVSFDKGTTGGQSGNLNGETGALVRTETDDGDSDSGMRRGTPNGSATPEADAGARGNELAVVPEDRESDNVVSKTPSTVQAKPDPQPGDYWMKPSRAELSKLPREKLQNFVGFEVGRKGCGKVVFNGPVDLTAIPLDDLFEKIVEIRLRSVTVYPDASTKPPVGKGLNVPSTIFIENSWPRSRGQPSSATSGPVFEKHVNRLKKMHGTEFINYEPSTGVWTFRVPHYTRYGLDYDEDDEELGQSQLSLPPNSANSAMEVDSDDQGESEDDTFAFKQKTVPGGFGRRSAIDYDDNVPSAQMIDDVEEEARSVEHSEEETSDNEVSMAGSFPPPGGAPAFGFQSPNKSILKPGRLGTPSKPLISLEGDWAEQLQRTISPRKQNRDALREVQNRVLLDHTYEPIKPTTSNKNEFRTSIDIMNSLFSKHEERMAKGRKAQAGPDLEFPYAKRTKTFDDDELPETDKRWHSSFKPRFTQTNGLIYRSNGRDAADAGWTRTLLLEGPNGDVALTLLDGKGTLDLESLLVDTQITIKDQAPFATHTAVPFSRIKDQLVRQRGSGAELDIYEVAHVLFDDYEDEFTAGLGRQQQQEFMGRIRKARLSKYLSSLVWSRHAEQIKSAETQRGATAAILHLTAKNVKAACDALLQEKDFHLMMLVSQIEQADDTFQDDMANQLMAWRKQGILSEMTEEIRALYEVLSGNTSFSQGVPDGPVESRATTFAISERFDLDWIQAFCLCLWYGRWKNGDIRDAVREFQKKLDTGEEAASPEAANGDEDPLWVLLKLYACTAQFNNARTRSGIEVPVFPEAFSSLSGPWDCYKTFRLHHALAAAIPDIVTIDQAKADELATSLAFERSARGDVLGAIWALLHITDSTTRQSFIIDLLARHAAALPDPPSSSDVTEQQQSTNSLWRGLVTSLKVPGSWICRAKALYARSSNTSLEELNLLIAAEDFAEAHECLLRRVAPRLVIDEDWETLRNILAKFGQDPEAKIDSAEWQAGGAVYADFVSLMGIMGFGSTGNTVNRKNLLQRLQTALTGLKNASNTNGSLSAAQNREKLEERVALCEMARVVARALEMDLDEDRRSSVGDKKSILDLPLGADARLSHARALGVDYYRGVMAMAR